MKIYGKVWLISNCVMLCLSLYGQKFYLGADQSYVNEMEDCGVVYKVNGEASVLYSIFKEQGSNLVRLRLWHTPDWYDDLNEGRRYSDFDDVKKSIKRAKSAGMEVLLDFHLSDEWADPAKQIIPQAWLPVVDDLTVLQDSLHHYIYHTLSLLEKEDLVPDMVQVGNETNKGILQTKEDNADWKLEWPRNKVLFNAGLSAVDRFNSETGSGVKKMIHFAGPKDAQWLMEQFSQNGVQNFDILGISYYWAWHQPTTIQETGNIIRELKNKYDKEVMIVETGYIWTTASNDSANNIISEYDSNYGLPSPESQKKWLIALKKEVKSAGGLGVIYWEPSWVSSPCNTLWGQGSHQEHAAFFDFENNLLLPGGIEWMQEDAVSTIEQNSIKDWTAYFNVDQSILVVEIDEIADQEILVYDTTGALILTGKVSENPQILSIEKAISGHLVVVLRNESGLESSQVVPVIKR